MSIKKSDAGKTVMVTAHREGYYKNAIRRIGETFEVEKHQLGSWMSVDGEPWEPDFEVKDKAVVASAKSKVNIKVKKKPVTAAQDLI